MLDLRLARFDAPMRRLGLRRLALRYAAYLLPLAVVTGGGIALQHLGVTEAGSMTASVLWLALPLAGLLYALHDIHGRRDPFYDRLARTTVLRRSHGTPDHRGSPADAHGASGVS